MISRKRLMAWRKEALQLAGRLDNATKSESENVLLVDCLDQTTRVLVLTQELIDQDLLRQERR